MEHKETKELLKKYLSGKCSPAERQRIENWYAEQLIEREREASGYDREKVKETIWGDIGQRRSVTRRQNRWLYPASAVAAVLIGFFLYLFIQPNGSTEESAIAQTEISPVVPARNKAILTTGGKQYVLDDIADGIVEQGDGFVITKEEGGILAFDAIGATASSSTAYNTIETPKGGIYRVTLPDGSKVWLNNASSISFPSSFDTDQRTVSIRGEVYFEVAHDARRPFRVHTAQQEIEVLGTQFNINAYEEEPFAKTTLVQGSVKVTGQSGTQVLKPGYEMISSTERQDRVALADMRSVLAWKDGIFRFERVRLDVIMRQIARWYDIELVYEGRLPQDEFVGEMKRSEDIHKVLEILQEGQIDLTLKGRKLIVGHKK